MRGLASEHHEWSPAFESGGSLSTLPISPAWQSRLDAIRLRSRLVLPLLGGLLRARKTPVEALFRRHGLKSQARILRNRRLKVGGGRRSR